MAQLNLLIQVGATQICFALLLAWVMVLTSHFKVHFLVKRVKSYSDLIKAHLDYLLMGLFLLTFWNLYKNAGIYPTQGTILFVVYGSTVNPLGFLIPALKPEADNMGFFSWYRLLVFSGFIATTLGFASVAWDVFRSV